VPPSAPARVWPIVPRAARAPLIGSAGLTLDAKGAPAVAYASYVRRSQKSYLRLVRLVSGRLHTTAVTTGGFPPSDRPPSATPVLLPHAELVSMALTPDGPEVAANDWADVGESRDYAGLLVDAQGRAVELDGRLAAYAAPTSGPGAVLLQREDGLEYFPLPSQPPVAVTLTANATGRLSGRVDGAQGGTVELYREQAQRPRVLVATVSAAPDGSFSAQDTAPTSPTLYRAV